MKVLIYGSKGWIGSQFIELMKSKNIDYFCGLSRVDDENSVSKELDSINPTHIISFIGRTHGKIDNKVFSTIDYLEQEGKLFENMRDNLFGPLLLSKLSIDKNIHFSYLGTGCIDRKSVV